MIGFDLLPTDIYSSPEAAERFFAEIDRVVAELEHVEKHASHDQEDHGNRGSQVRPRTVRDVNAALEAAGHKERLVRGKGYYYFTNTDGAWFTSSVYVNSVDEMTVDEWLRERDVLAEDVRKHADHDQSDHGNWSDGGAAYVPTPDAERKLRDAFKRTGDIRDDPDMGDDARHEQAARDAGIAEPVMGIASKDHDVLTEYKAQEEPVVNDWLRRGRRAGPGYEYAKENEAAVRAIDAAIAKQPPLAEPLVVFRGMNVSPEGVGLDIPGAEFTDDAYVSTSLEAATANNWAAGSKSALVKITVPAGQRVLYMEPWASESSGSNEHEVLLPRGSRFRVKRYVPGTRGNQFQGNFADHYGARPAYIEVEMIGAKQ